MNIFRHDKHKRLIVIVLVTLAGIFLAGCASGLFPQFTYQGVLTDAGGSPIDGDVTITYRIFNAASGGTAMYTENETVTLTDGRFDSVVGPQTDFGSLSPEDLAQPLWIELQVGNGTYTETLTPRQRLYGAPYAFTLMPGTVISATMNKELYGLGGINAVASVYNMEEPDPLPALRVVGQQGIELVGAGDNDGTLYSEIGDSSSDILMYSNDEFYIYIDSDDSGETGYFMVRGNGTNQCWISDEGDLFCTGSITTSSLMNGEPRSLYSVQSTDVRIEDFGSGRLSKGAATVEVDLLFAQSVNLAVDYHVFLTPLGDCKGLYVTNKTATGFEVHELGGGNSDVSFDYRIVAKRAGYEDVRMELAPMGAELEGE